MIKLKRKSPYGHNVHEHARIDSKGQLKFVSDYMQGEGVKLRSCPERCIDGMDLTRFFLVLSNISRQS